MEKKVAVVTGANGFVGSHLVDLLLEKNFEVRCVTRRSSNLKWLNNKDVKIFDCGLTNKESLRKVFDGADYIYHVAGVVKSKKPEGYFEGNVETTRVLLDTALEFKESIKKFLIVSSQTAAGPSHEGKAINEDNLPNPLTTYGKSKLAQEFLAEGYMDRLPIVICRAPAVYGERDTEILIFFETYSKGLFTTIGFNKKEVSLIHVRDLVEGFYLAAVNESSAGKIYFIGSEKYYSWEEVGKTCEKVFGKKAFHVAVPHVVVFGLAAIAQFFSIFSKSAATLNIEKARDITQEYWICDTSKAVRELGYNQKITLEEGIRRTIAWYKENKWIK